MYSILHPELYTQAAACHQLAAALSCFAGFHRRAVFMSKLYDTIAGGLPARVSEILPLACLRRGESEISTE